MAITLVIKRPLVAVAAAVSLATVSFRIGRLYERYKAEQKGEEVYVDTEEGEEEENED